MMIKVCPWLLCTGSIVLITWLTVTTLYIKYRCRISLRMSAAILGHSDIGVTMNVYTHLGLEEAADELKRIEALELARKEIEKKPDTPPEQLLFRSV